LVAAFLLAGCVPQEEDSPAPLNPKQTGPIKLFCINGAELAKRKAAGGKKCCTPGRLTKSQPGDDPACCVVAEPGTADLGVKKSAGKK
jgi:hypothetical protein